MLPDQATDKRRILETFGGLSDDPGVDGPAGMDAGAAWGGDSSPQAAGLVTTLSSGVDLVGLGVELAVPLAELHDRAVGVGERGRRQERLVLPDRLVLLDLLVDLLHERVGDGRRELLVVELAHDEVEPHLRGLVVDRRGGRDVDRVDDAAEPHLREAGPVVVDVDAAVRDAARRDVRLLRQHHRARAVGVVALHLGDVVGAVHVLEVRGVDAVLRHLLRHRADHVRRRVEVAPRGIADLLDHRDLPLRRFLVRVVPREHEAVAHDRRVGAQLAPCGWCAGCTGCSCTRRRRRSASRGTGTAARCRAPCRRTRGARRGAGRTRPGGGSRRPCRATARARGSSTRARVTSPGARSSGNATWNQPNGVGNGKRREAMAAILEHVSIIGQQRPGARRRPARPASTGSRRVQLVGEHLDPDRRDRARSRAACRSRPREVELARAGQHAARAATRSGRSGSGAAGPSSSWIPSTRSPGHRAQRPRRRHRCGSSATRRRARHRSGRSARRTISHAAVDVGDARPRQEFDVHEQAVLGGAVAETGERGRGFVDGPLPPNTSIALSDRGTDGVGDPEAARASSYAKSSSVSRRGGNVHVGRARKPPPREVDLGDGEPVVGEQRADVGIRQAVTPRAVQ